MESTSEAVLSASWSFVALLGSRVLGRMHRATWSICCGTSKKIETIERVIERTDGQIDRSGSGFG